MRNTRLSTITFHLLSFAICLMAYMALALSMSATYRAMQLDSFFLFTADYFHTKLSMPPALVSWTSSLLLQLFRWPLVGALVQGVIAWFTTVSLCRLLRLQGWKMYLSLLPSALLFLFWSFSLQLQLQVLVISFVAFLYSRLPLWWERAVLAVLMLALGFMLLNTPLLIALFLILAVVEWRTTGNRLHVLCVAAVLFASLLLPTIYSQRLAFIPAGKRYTYVTEGHPKALWDEAVLQNDAYYDMLCAAEEERWRDMRRIIRDSGMGRMKLIQAYLLLAESAEGTLADNLFSYQINDSEDFFFRHNQDLYSCQFNRLFYRNLGLWDESFHQAQEYFLLLPDACCFRSLTQMVDYSIREGEFAVAEKYLAVLSHAPFYGDFVQEQRDRIARQRTAKPVVRPLRADNFVGGYPFLSEMARLYENSEGNSMRILDYLLCGLLLHKKLQSFEVAFREYPTREDLPLPASYAQAFRLLHSGGQIPEEECVWGTYYYYYRNIEAPEPNSRMRSSVGH